MKQTVMLFALLFLAMQAFGVYHKIGENGTSDNTRYVTIADTIS